MPEYGFFDEVGFGEPREAPTWEERCLPIDDEQTCAFCGSVDWAWVYPLDGKHPGSVTLGWFWCACDDCHAVVEAADDVALNERHARRDPDGDEVYDFRSVVLPLFWAARQGPALARAAAQQPG